MTRDEAMQLARAEYKRGIIEGMDALQSADGAELTVQQFHNSYIQENCKCASISGRATCVRESPEPHIAARSGIYSRLAAQIHSR